MWRAGDRTETGASPSHTAVSAGLWAAILNNTATNRTKEKAKNKQIAHLPAPWPPPSSPQPCSTAAAATLWPTLRGHHACQCPCPPAVGVVWAASGGRAESGRRTPGGPPWTLAGPGTTRVTHSMLSTTAGGSSSLQHVGGVCPLSAASLLVQVRHRAVLHRGGALVPCPRCTAQRGAAGVWRVRVWRPCVAAVFGTNQRQPLA